MASCVHCGAEITIGSRYCASCGRPATPSGAGSRRPSQESIESGEQRLLEALRSATLGDYEILGELGRGGMAVVFLAYDIALERKVAIKVMSPALLLMDPAIQARFKREARTAAALSHPHVIPVYAVKEGSDLVYFVMKYIEGRGLDSVISEVGQLPIPAIVTILQQAGAALAYAHRKGVVHRDIKPANIMLDEEGWVVVTDLGIAKVAQGEALTVTGGVVGTPAYMSPEQCQGLDIDGATDQYALGVVAYEMIAGRPPFQGTSMVNLIYQHSHEDPVPVSEQRFDCPPGLAATVMRMLAKKKADRFPGVDDAIAAIGSIEAESEEARTQILTFVQSVPSDTEQLIAKFQTRGKPLTPLPSTARQPAASDTPSTAAPIATAGGPARRSSRKWAVIGIPVVAVAATFSWFVWQSSGVDQQTAGPGTSQPETNATTAARTPVPAQIEITPQNVRLEVGATTTLVATPRNDSGQIVNAEVQWESLDPSIATVIDGVVTALGPGTARLVARSGGSSATVSVQVRTAAPVAANAPPSPARIAVSPQSVTTRVGESTSLRATVLDRGGGVLGGHSLTWHSTVPSVATVTSDGRVNSIAAGNTTITAQAAGLTAIVSVTVTAAAVAAVEIAPRTVAIRAGDATLLQATTRDEGGAALTNRSVTWESSNPNVARVSTGGRVTGVGPGTVRISALSEGVAGQATVTVEAVTAPEPGGALEPPANPRPMILAEVERYRQAIASASVAQLKQVYPAMPADQERAWQQFFDGVADLTARFDNVDLQVSGNEATARVSAVYRFRAGRAQTQETTVTIQLRRSGGQWRITSVN